MLNLATLFWFLGLSIVCGGWFGGNEVLPVSMFVGALIYWVIRIWTASKERKIALVRAYGIRFVATVFGLLLGSFISRGINVFVAENTFMILGVIVLLLVQTYLVVSIPPDAKDDEMILPIALGTTILAFSSLILFVLDQQQFPIGRWDIWYFVLSIVMLAMTLMRSKVRRLYTFVLGKQPAA